MGVDTYVRLCMQVRIFIYGWASNMGLIRGYKLNCRRDWGAVLQLGGRSRWGLLTYSFRMPISSDPRCLFHGWVDLFRFLYPRFLGM
jgi:hypothetical protein